MIPYFLNSNKKIIMLIFFLTMLISSFFLINKYIEKTTNLANAQIQPNSQEALEEVKKFTVCIDPGHGGYDPGTTVSNVLEKDVALKIALKIGSILEDKNINVIYTRTSDEVSWPNTNKQDLRARASISNESKADAFVSIHCNSGLDASYNGVETWCRFPNTDGENLAKAIQSELVKANYTLDRGLKYEKQQSLAILKFNDAPAALVETGFLTNTKDFKFISSEDGQTTCAESIAEGIIKFLNI